MHCVLQQVEPETFLIKADGDFPNNASLPLLLYRKALRSDQIGLESRVQKIFVENCWRGCWVNGIYAYHHYHSTAHEALAITAGGARVQFGGPQGIKAEVQAGDVVVIPAGVSHKRLSSQAGFTVVGAYPDGQDHDMCYGESKERPAAQARVAQVPLPDTDPLYGSSGPLHAHWRD